LTWNLSAECHRTAPAAGSGGSARQVATNTTLILVLQAFEQGKTAISRAAGQCVKATADRYPATSAADNSFQLWRSHPPAT
jgi:hypothetical protein